MFSSSRVLVKCLWFGGSCFGYETAFIWSLVSTSGFLGITLRKCRIRESNFPTIAIRRE